MEQAICEICGKRPAKAVILLEGAKMLACGGCMRSGKVIHRLSFDEKKGGLVSAPRKEAEEELVEDYPSKIKKARQKLGLPIAVIAERISEKKSHLEAVEAGRIKPTMSTAKKLEKELKIKLIEKIEASVTPTIGGKKGFSEPTLADMIEKKKGD